jgi:hypothetical protein
MQARCCICKKKLGILPFKCKCEREYCSLHRAPEEHECTYDFKNDAKILLEKRNPVCLAPKLENKL